LFIIEKNLFNSIDVRSFLAIDSFNAHDFSTKDVKDHDVNISKFLLRNDLDSNYNCRRNINTYVVYTSISARSFTSKILLCEKTYDWNLSRQSQIISSHKSFTTERLTEDSIILTINKEITISSRVVSSLRSWWLIERELNFEFLWKLSISRQLYIRKNNLISFHHLRMLNTSFRSSTYHMSHFSWSKWSVSHHCNTILFINIQRFVLSSSMHISCLLHLSFH
jgi:hypothetical protein